MKKGIFGSILLGSTLLLAACSNDAESAQKEPKEEQNKEEMVVEEPKLEDNEIMVTLNDGSEEIQETKEYELDGDEGSIKTIKGYSLSEDGYTLSGVGSKVIIGNLEYDEYQRIHIVKIENDMKDDYRPQEFRDSYSFGEVAGEHKPVEEGEFNHPFLDDDVVVFDEIQPDDEDDKVSYGINKYTEDYNQKFYIRFDKDLTDEEIEEKMYEIMSMLETLPTSNGVKESVDVVIPNFEGRQSEEGGEVKEVISENELLVRFCDTTELKNGACNDYSLLDPNNLLDLNKGDLFLFKYELSEDDEYVVTDFIEKFGER